MSMGATMLDNTILSQLLGVAGIDELRTKLIDMIVDEVHEQLRQSSEYIISPDDIANDLYEDVIDDIKSTIVEEYKGRIVAAVDKKMEGLGI